MVLEPVEIKASELECCPTLQQRPVCDTLDLRYRLPFRKLVDRKYVWVEVVLHFRFQRCSEGLVLGDPIYSTTLFPGEQVRLFTSDRHSRWSYDSASSLAYRHATTSEESFYTAAMARAVSDLTINEQASSSSTFEESWEEGGAGTGGFLGWLLGSASYSYGNYDAESTFDFSRSLSRHAECASAYVAAGVRAKSATSIGEVERRAHAEGESEAHYESSSRLFRNPNKCHAVTYLFYKINKLQRVNFKLVAIERRIEDPAAPTGAYQRVPVDTTGQVMIKPDLIPAASKDRLEVEERARKSAVDRLEFARAGVAVERSGSEGTLTRRDVLLNPGPLTNVRVAADPPEPISTDLREAARKEVDADLAQAGLLDPKTGKPTETVVAELSWEREEILPTPGILVKGCLDKCDTCEPALQKEIQLDLERKRLDNEMLKRQVELLEKSQEYRCPPDENGEEEEPPNE